MAFGVCTRPALLYVFFFTALLFKGQENGVCARPLTSFQPLRNGLKYAFRCEPECTQRSVTGFGKPVTWVFSNHSVTSDHTYGYWTVDPTTNCGSIYVLPGYTNIRNVVKYESMEKLQAGVASELIQLPSPGADGTGSVIFNGSIYYNVVNTAKLSRLPLSTKESAVTVSLDDASYHNGGGQYDSAGYNDIDFAVSETGLYVIYGSKSRSNKLAVAKLNPETLAAENTFHFNEKKTRFGNCFIVCATVYCTEDYNAKVTTVSFGYDLNDKVQLQPGFPFINAYKINSMIDYNPFDRKLYSWGNKHLVTYEVIFQP